MARTGMIGNRQGAQWIGRLGPNGFQSVVSVGRFVEAHWWSRARVDMIGDKP